MLRICLHKRSHHAAGPAYEVEKQRNQRAVSVARMAYRVLREFMLPEITDDEEKLRWHVRHTCANEINVYCALPSRLLRQELHGIPPLRSPTRKQTTPHGPLWLSHLPCKRYDSLTDVGGFLLVTLRLLRNPKKVNDIF